MFKFVWFQEQDEFKEKSQNIEGVRRLMSPEKMGFIAFILMGALTPYRTAAACTEKNPVIVILKKSIFKN